MLITCIKTFIKKLPTWSGQVILHISKPEVSGITFVSLWIFFPEKLSPGIYHPNPMRIWSSRPFRKHIIPEIVHLDWCFTLIEDHSTQPLHFENCLMNWMLSSPSRKRDILLITPAAKVSSNISKKKKPTGVIFVPIVTYTTLSSNISKASITLADHMVL